MCTVLIVAWLMAMTSYLAYVYIHPPYMRVKDLAYMPNNYIKVTQCTYVSVMKLCQHDVTM